MSSTSSSASLPTLHAVSKPRRSSSRKVLPWPRSQSSAPPPPGALPGSQIRGAVGCSFSPYNSPSVLSVGYDVLSNRSKVAAYRAPGAPIGAFAVECVLDELAEALKMDPLELRLKNAAKQGTKAAHGPVFPRIGYIETLEAAKAHPHYSAPLGKLQGKGVASGFWFNAGGESSAQG